MTSSKRIQLTVLLIVAVALFAGAPAFAQTTYGPFTLNNTTSADDPDHLATGQDTLTLRSIPRPLTWAFGNLTATCQDLTPDQLYRIGPLPDPTKRGYSYYVPFTASVDGSGSAVAQVGLQIDQYGVGGFRFKVDRVVSSKGKGKYVTVFSGVAVVQP